MSDDAELTERRGHRSGIWRNRDFRLVWAGQALSEVGTGISQLAYPLLMLVLTESPAQAGALSAVRALPYLFFGLSAGALADRWDRKRMMVCCDVGRAVLMASIPAALWLDQLTPLQLYVTGFLGGVFSAAEAGALPNVVTEEELTTAISAQDGAGSVGAVVAPPLGGALFGAFSGLPFLTDAISYLVSAGAVQSVRTRFDRSDGSRPATSVRQDAVEGLRWMWRHTAIRSIAVIAAGLQVAISGVTLVVIVAARVTGASSLITGLLLAAVGIGGVSGALLTPMVKRRWGFGRLLLAVIWAQAGLWVLFAISPGLIFTGVVLALFAASMPMFGIASHSYLLAATPDRLRGRVITSFGLLTWGATPLGAAAAGFLLDSLAPSVVAWCFAGWVAVLAVVISWTRTLRSLPT